jgi:hypothetical protein
MKKSEFNKGIGAMRDFLTKMESDYRKESYRNNLSREEAGEWWSLRESFKKMVRRIETKTSLLTKGETDG